MTDKTTIQVSTELRNKLWEAKGPGRSYEDVLEEHLPDEMLDA